MKIFRFRRIFGSISSDTEAANMYTAEPFVILAVSDSVGKQRSISSVNLLFCRSTALASYVHLVIGAYRVESQS